MKSKLLILSLFLCLNLQAQKLPIIGLCWGDVFTLLGVTCSPDAFSVANPAYFDPTYAVSGNCLDDFRNYGLQVGLPTVRTFSTQVAALTWHGGGEVTSTGGSPITAQGVCRSTSENPTTADYHTSEWVGSGYFESYFSVPGYDTGTIYHVRAYATNSYGTAYGSDILIACSRPDIHNDRTYYYKVNGVSINSEANALYYANNFSCSGECLGREGEAYGNDIYAIWGNTDCTRVQDGYYVEEESGEYSPVQIISGVRYQIYPPCSINTESYLTCTTTSVSLTVDCDGNYSVSFTYVADEACIGLSPQLTIYDGSHTYVAAESVSGSWSGNTFTGSGTLSTGLADGYYVSIDLYP